MDKELNLYYDPLSFFSKKVRWCLEEKKVSYNETIVSLVRLDYIQPWFIRINPKGEVPVLQHGDTYITESLNISKYIDSHFGAVTMFPDETTQTGALVKKYGDICRSVEIEMMTYAFLLNTDLQRDAEIQPESSKAFKDSDKAQGKTLKLYEELAEQNPELKDAYMSKIEILKNKLDTLTSQEDIEAGIEGTLRAMYLCEQKLKANETAGYNDHWLCGPNLTYADIELGNLLDRLKFVGAGYRTWLDGKHPQLEKYFLRLEGRPQYKVAIRDVNLIVYKKH